MFSFDAPATAENTCSRFASPVVIASGAKQSSPVSAPDVLIASGLPSRFAPRNDVLLSAPTCSTQYLRRIYGSIEVFLLLLDNIQFISYNIKKEGVIMYNYYINMQTYKKTLLRRGKT